MISKRLREVLIVSCALSALAAPPLRAAFLRGDMDQNGTVDITDAINILGFLFLGGTAPPCRPVADVSADGALDVTDAVALLNHLFLAAPPPSNLSMDEVAVCKGLDPAAVQRGMMVYGHPDPGSEANPPTANFTACSTCHEMIPDRESSFVLPGHSLFDALRRPSFKGTLVRNFLGAANVCRRDWMATKSWQEDDAAFRDLVAFMESIAPESQAPALVYEVECEPKPGPVGDGVLGCKLFNRSCAVCHGMGALGNDFRAPSLVDLNSICLDDLGPNSPCPDSGPNYIRNRIRRSGPSRMQNPEVVYPDCLIGNTTMPFWSKDKLSDRDVEDLIAFIGLARAEKRKDPENPKATFDCADQPPDPTGRVLRRGEFRNAAPQYGVSGIAEELDTRKLRLLNFNYRGTGIIVKAWLFNQGGIRDGVPFGPDLRRAEPYVSETVVIDIPPEHYDGAGKLKYDSVSIWCLQARVSFADAKLEI